MCLLGIEKLHDLESSSTMFLNYDLLTWRVMRCGYVHRSPRRWRAC
jgi:hypothetical protein